MVLAQDDDVVQALPSDRSDQPFRVPVLPWQARGGGPVADAHLAKRTNIPARDAGKIFDAVKVLRGMETAAEPPRLGRRVIVYGGGNTALDVARTAKRLGADDTLIVYRRTREQMPAHDFEVEEALEEGVMMRWLRTIKQIDHTTFTVEKMEIDETGWPQPTGEFETIEADTLILALGQDADTGLMSKIPGVVIGADGVAEIDENMMTGYPGLFAGGDMVPAERPSPSPSATARRRRAISTPISTAPNTPPLRSTSSPPTSG